MKFEVIPVGAYAANCTILWQDPEAAWLIDPGADGDDLLQRLQELKLKLGVVVLTHAHFDHISAVNEIVKVFPVPVYLHEADQSIAFSPLNSMYPYSPTFPPATLDVNKKHGDTIECGGVVAEIIHTPGHTPGGWSLYFKAEDLLVAGDTLFAGSVGRTDFPGGSSRVLSQSLKSLTKLPPHTKVICGHGPMTTIAREIRNNPYL